MDNKITTTRLAAMLSESTGKQKKLCEDFVKEFFKVVSAELEKGENVRVKGFGTFKISEIEARKSVSVSTGDEVEIPGHKRVLFVAAKELAAIVNAPFAAFEASEVEDDISTELLTGEDLPEFAEDALSSIEEDASGQEEDIAEHTEEISETLEEDITEPTEEEISETEEEETSEPTEEISGTEEAEINEPTEEISETEEEEITEPTEEEISETVEEDIAEPTEEISETVEEDIAEPTEEISETVEVEISEPLAEVTTVAVEEDVPDTVMETPAEVKETVGDWMEKVDDFEFSEKREMISDEGPETIGDWMESVEGSDISDEINHEAEEAIADEPLFYVADKPQEFEGDGHDEFVADEPQEFEADEPEEFVADTPQEFAADEPQGDANENPHDFMNDEPQEYDLGESIVYSEDETQDYFPDDTNDMISEETSMWSKEDTSAFSVKKIRKKIFSRRKKERKVNSDPRPAYDDAPKYRSGGSHRFLYGFLTGILIALIIGVLLFIFVGLKPIEDEFYRQGVEDAMLELSKLQAHPADDDTQGSVNNIAQTPATEVLPESKGNVAGENTSVVEQGDASRVPTQASDARIYDTVSTTRYLTTMAGEHYGNKDLWPIIYEENKAILGHPDKITPGTRVRIPSLRKYHVSATNPEDIKRIKAKGDEIYRRYTVK